MANDGALSLMGWPNGSQLSILGEIEAPMVISTIFVFSIEHYH
jgi:hypothetical protein